jgi:hypothetical protein
MMKLIPAGASGLLLAVAVLVPFNSPAAGVLTVQAGSPLAPPTTLISHLDIWRWHKGTNAPQTGWQSASDVTLNADWDTGPGGFGYSRDTANETNQCRTILFDMSGTSATNFSTFYIRKEVQITAPVDPTVHIQLTMDYDDAFVAYLDGVEIARSASAPGSVGTEPAYTALATSTHESSRGTSTPVNPPSVLDLGAVGSRLGIGTHILAVIGLNQNKSTSSDFILIGDLTLSGGAGGSTVSGTFLSIVYSNSVVLSGSNTVAGSTRVTVNGDDATFSTVSGTWTNPRPLATGLNRFFIAAHDSTGVILASTNQDVISEQSSTFVGGVLASNSVWTAAMGIIHVTNTVMVPARGSLSIGEGSVVLVGVGLSIRATNATLTATGSVQNPVYFLPADGTATWGGVLSSGASGQLTLRRIEIVASPVQILAGATGLLEDSTLRDYRVAVPPLFYTENATSVTMRRCHLTRYYETHWVSTLSVIEDSLFEFMDSVNSDGIDFDTVPTGSAIRRCTLRHAPQTNTDAIDLGTGCLGTVVEHCMMYDISDKGVSIGEDSLGIVVRNCLMYKVDSGVAVKDGCTAELHHLTVSESDYGVRLYQKTAGLGGGQVTNAYNNVLWGNTNDLLLDSLSTIDISYSDVQGTNWPGTGNLDADPLFVNAAQRDYRLAAGSPCLGTGLGGSDMGITLPVGGVPGAPMPLAALANGINPVILTWTDDAGNEDGFLLERSVNGTNWQWLASVSANVTNYTDTTGVQGQNYYYRVQATNTSGASPFSNPASAMRLAPVVFVGGTVSAETTWSAGTEYVVTNNLTVAAGVTLTIQPGTTVSFDQGFGMTINGRLLAEGTSTGRIRFARHTGATSWTRLDFGTSAFESRIAYADIDGATTSGNVRAVNTSIYLDRVVFTNTLVQLVTLDNASCTILNCYFPSIQNNELLHFFNMPAGGHALIASNQFGTPGIATTSGYNDIIDFTGGNRPGPIVEFIGNTFLSAVDDVFDMDGTDAHIEGNIFINVMQDAQRDSGSYPITTGASGSDLSQLVVCRNIFYNCEHTLLIKEHGSMLVQNNTVLRLTTNTTARTASGAQIPPGIINFGEPWRGVSGGDGAICEGNIVWDLEASPFNYFTNGTMFLTVAQSLMQGTNFPGTGNLSSDPLFVSGTNLTYLNIRSNLALLPGSPCLGTGPNGIDMGALVPVGASIAGEPVGTTTNRNATLTVAGPGVFAYKWKLNDGTWSAEAALTTNIVFTANMFANAQPITLTNLADGTYTVSIIGKNSAGTWQDTSNPTVSKTWMVQTTVPPRISRIVVEGITAEGGVVSLHFTAQAGQSYSVIYRDAFDAAHPWQKLTGADLAARNTNAVVSVTNAPVNVPTRFYQIVTPARP